MFSSDLDYDVKAPNEVKDDFDLAVDCSGSGPAMQCAVSQLRPGGRLCIFGAANPKATFTLHPFDVRYFTCRSSSLVVADEIFVFSVLHERVESSGCEYKSIYVPQGIAAASCYG